MKFFRCLLILQSAYILLTALWPLADMESFMLVSGYKTDKWLVKTVSAILIPIALCLISYIFIPSDLRPAILLASTTAAGLAAIDFYYASSDVISRVYLLDGIAELLFLGGWLVFALRYRRQIF